MATQTKGAETEILSPILHLSQEEMQAFYDRTVRETLGISADEFVHRWEAGEYDHIPDDSEHWDILYLLMLGGLGK